MFSLLQNMVYRITNKTVQIMDFLRFFPASNMLCNSPFDKVKPKFKWFQDIKSFKKIFY